MTTKILPPNLVSDTKPTEQFRITAKEKVQALKEDPLVERIKALENEIQRLKGINAKLTQEYSLLKDENNRLIKQCGTLTKQFATKSIQKDDKLYELYEANKELFSALHRYHLFGFGEKISTPEQPEEMASWINDHLSKLISIIAGKDHLNNEVFGKSTESGKERAKPQRKSLLIKYSEEEVKIQRCIDKLEQQNDRKCAQVVKDVEKINNNHKRLDDAVTKLEKVRKLRLEEEDKLSKSNKKLNQDTFAGASKLEDPAKVSEDQENKISNELKVNNLDHVIFL